MLFIISQKGILGHLVISTDIIYAFDICDALSPIVNSDVRIFGAVGPV